MKLRDIKDNFNEREIQPGAGSWEKLSAQLDAVESKEKRPYLYWLGAIAAILVVALIAYPAISGINSGILGPDNQVVIQESVNVDEAGTEVNKSPKNDVAVEVKSDSEFNEQEKSIEKEKEKAPAAKNLPAAIPVKEALAQAHSSERISSKIHKSTASNATLSNDENITSKIETVDISTIAQVENGQPLTADQEAALLLKSLLENPENKTDVATHYIKPKQLLRETEWDVEADRRNRINKELKDGLGRLKNEAFALIGVNN